MTRLLLALVLSAVIAAASTQAPRPAADSPRPTRIVSLVPAVTEMLFAMGAGPQVAGVSSFDREPAEVEALPRVGGLLDPNVERLLALRPDLVIVYGTQNAIIDQLSRAGIPCYPYVHAGLSDVMATIRGVGGRVGQAAGAEALATRIERDLDAVRVRVAGRPRPRTLLVFEREAGQLQNIWASGGRGFLHDMLTIAGGEDVFGGIPRESVQVGLETLMASPPEVIVELHYGRHYAPAELAAEREAWNRLTTLPAVRRNRVYLLAGEEFVVPGPRVALAAERIARVLHPEAFTGDGRR